MNLASKWILGALSAFVPLDLLTFLPILFRSLGEVAQAGGHVTPEQAATGESSLVWLGVGSALAIPAVGMSLFHLFRGKVAVPRRGLWVLFLLICSPLALPVYFGLFVYGDDLEDGSASGQKLPLRLLGAVLTILFSTMILVDVVMLCVSLDGQFAHSLAVGSGEATGAEIEVGWSLCTLTSWLQTLGWWVCAIVFLAWFYRSYHNLLAAKLDGVSYRTGWTIAGFYIPFVNFVLPYRIMTEVWRGSLAIADSRKAVQWQSLPVSAMVGPWWCS